MFSFVPRVEKVIYEDPYFAKNSNIAKILPQVAAVELNQDEADACMIALSGIDKQLKLFGENKK